MYRYRPSSTIIAVTLCLVLGQAAAARPLEFDVRFDRSVTALPFTGRVYVMLSRRPIEGLSSPDWFDPEPFFALDVKDWKPGEPAVLGRTALAYPTPLARLSRGTYWVQAVMDFDRGAQSFTTAEGNGFSRALKFALDPDTTGPVALTIDRVYHAPVFHETDSVKLVDIESKLLTAFHGRPVHLRAGVVLPSSFTSSPTRRYPVIYDIPGFGGDHFGALHKGRGATNVAGVEMLYVVLDPTCRTGHHAFADSENNGPYGRALTEELIPAIEARFRGLGVPAARFVTGHSSGGWSSLWLQVSYPDFFDGVWSTAPDEVDFRDFQRTNIYEPGVNLFVDANHRPRTMARGRDGKPTLFNQPSSDMEIVMGHGGQLGTYEAVYSPRGPDGKPRQLWDRRTGAIDPAIARSWEKYDIRLKLERNWTTLGPRLAGKLHVYVGGNDTYYLEIAVGMLKAALARLGSDAEIEIIPGRDHGNLLDRSLRDRIAREMAVRFREHFRDGR